MVPNKGRKTSSPEAAANVIRDNKGATAFFNYLRREFTLAADDVERDLIDLENKIFPLPRRRMDEQAGRH